MESDHKLRTLTRSTVAIASVVLVELILGLVVNSLAIVSDGLHALLDALTTFMLLVTMRLSVKPPDEEHMYGHEKFESIGGLVGGIVLIGVALLIMYEAILKTISNQRLNLGIEYVGFVAVGYTLCIDFFRVGSFMYARRAKSLTMKAGFYHALADLSSTIIALVGFGLATLGFYFGDSLASMVLGVLLCYFSVRLVWSSGMELADSVSKDIADKVRNEILETRDVCRLTELKIRKVGEKTFVRATVQVPDYMGLEEAHDLSSNVEAGIKSKLGNADVAIHTEPFETELSTVKLVENLAMEVAGVRGAHDVNVAYADARLYITLHAYVDAKLPIEQAHEIAERVEQKVRRKMRDVEDITVHIEPFSKIELKGTTVDEREIRTIIHKVADNYKDAFRVRRIVTYVADKKRYINIDCRFTKQISIEEAHEITSKIEEQIQKHFVETTATVHAEPS